ncbi:hypothetical protein ACLOJK_029072 [Asimina triloba]
MDEKSDLDKGDEVMLPGFRFHPTDEELVGFYLKRKIQQKPLSIELIRQLDIYKFDPWDLPKELATTGEKEWYFYCPRDRKYRNSARPNRVTGAGFWKATGTDRPIYSSEGTKCIGLKKSLVFYKGRAAKGIKTDWMMHEFRLPSLTDSNSNKKPVDKTIPANDAWAICRIFKKTNSMAQRALSQSWVSSLPETSGSDVFSQIVHGTQFTPENFSCSSQAGSSIHFGCNSDLQQSSPGPSFSVLEIPSYKPLNPSVYKPPMLPISMAEIPPGFMFAPLDVPVPPKCHIDVASVLLNLSPSMLGDVSKGPSTIDFGQHQQCNSNSNNNNSFTVSLPQEVHVNDGEEKEEATISTCHMNSQWGSNKNVNFPFNLPSDLSDEWKSNLIWGDAVPCPTELSTTYSTNKCYT